MTKSDVRVAVLIDCDNLPPNAAEHALRIAAQFGRVVIRRGYGNPQTLTSKWKETLVRLAFMPCLQYQYAPGKNTSDIALALDALEALVDQRADTFCLVTSDSDFTGLCRKLRERGGEVCIVGEAETPDALRNAADKFIVRDRAVAQGPAADAGGNAGKPGSKKSKAATASSTPQIKEQPAFLVEMVDQLASSAPDGKVALNILESSLGQRYPNFSSKTYGHAKLLKMVKAYELLTLQQEANGEWSVMKAPVADSPADAVHANGEQLLLLSPLPAHDQIAPRTLQEPERHVRLREPEETANMPRWPSY